MTEHSPAATASIGDPIEIDTSVAHAARVYDYMLGGATNFEADRAAAHAAAEPVPGGFEAIRASLMANRAFMVRAVRYLAGEAGIRQFLDIGSGIPNNDNVHDVAQQIAHESRVVYVDVDPIVLAHSHRLLQSTPEGVTAYVQEDLRNPARLIEQAAATLDLTRPVAVLMVAILHFIPDDDDPRGVVDHLLGALPPGSHLVVSHVAGDVADLSAGRERYNRSVQESIVLRCRDEVAAFFDGLDMVDPGFVLAEAWRPDPGRAPSAHAGLPLYGGVGRKP